MPLAGFIILKYYLDISENELERRLKERENDPLKQWKISPIDIEAQRYWHDLKDLVLLVNNVEHKV